MPLLSNKLSSLFAASHRLQFSTQTLNAEPHFIIPYLINTLGFSPDQALKASKSLTPRVKSPHRPDAVLGFLKHTAVLGLTDAHIKTLVSWYPALLSFSPDKTLAPRIKALESDGFSGLLLLQMIRSNPFLLTHATTLPRLRFWKSFFADNESHLMRALKRNRQLVNYNIENKIAPNLALLRSYGLADRDIAKVMMRVNGFIVKTPAAIRALIEQTKELGIAADSGLFSQGLSVVAVLKRDTLKKKMELFRCFRYWSEAEVLAIFRQCPTILGLSEANLRSKIEFFVDRARCEPSCIARRPMILGFSLERRLVPRHCILQVLKSKNLGKEIWDIFTAINLSEKSFVEKFVLQFKEQVPDLHETYLAACAGRFVGIADQTPS